VIKLNEGFSGEGNAVLDLREIQNSEPFHSSLDLRKQEIFFRKNCSHFHSIKKVSDDFHVSFDLYVKSILTLH